jgi:beta-lactamase class D
MVLQKWRLGMLTARESADRLQKRRHPKDSKETYTCENCSEHEFIVVRTYDEEAAVSRTLACQCDNHEELAATFDYRVTHHVMESGVLNDDHRAEWDSSEREVEEDRDETDREVKCLASLFAIRQQGILMGGEHGRRVHNRW